MSIIFERPVLCPIMVGRASYLELVKQRIEEARHGRGGTFLLVGEAGIGKSRLVAEAKSRAEDLTILQGNCFEADRGLPYAPILDLLRTFIASHSAEVLNPFLPELLKLLPELATRFPEAKATPALEPEQEKRRLFRALTELLSSPHWLPLQIIIEDLHWC